MVQSYAARELERALVSADGYGVGWFTRDGQPARYRSLAPVWQDPNLPELARSMSSELWVANVRSATLPLPVSYENTHPFSADGMLFSHNGYIEEFTTQVRPSMRRALEPEVEEGINGVTDSEHLFALIRQRLRNGATDIASATQEGIEDLAGLLPASVSALLSLIIATPREAIAVRHKLGGTKCPSLYIAQAHPLFAGGSLMASEPFDQDSSWDQVPEGRIVHLSRLAAGVGGHVIEVKKL